MGQECRYTTGAGVGVAGVDEDVVGPDGVAESGVEVTAAEVELGVEGPAAGVATVGVTAAAAGVELGMEGVAAGVATVGVTAAGVELGEVRVAGVATAGPAAVCTDGTGLACAAKTALNRASALGTRGLGLGRVGRETVFVPACVPVALATPGNTS
jgi:hypothetical protein